MIVEKSSQIVSYVIFKWITLFSQQFKNYIKAFASFSFSLNLKFKIKLNLNLNF